MLKSCPKSRGTVFSYDGLRRAEPLSCAVPLPDGAVIAHREQDIVLSCAVPPPDGAVIAHREQDKVLSCAVPPPDGAVIAHGEQDGPVPGQGGLPHCRCTLRNADQVSFFIIHL